MVMPRVRVVKDALRTERASRIDLAAKRLHRRSPNGLCQQARRALLGILHQGNGGEAVTYSTTTPLAANRSGRIVAATKQSFAIIGITTAA
jgi:hypothetical protein